MKIKLPTQTKEVIDGKLVVKASEIELKIDTSLLAQQRFETKFPKLAEKEDLEGYSKRICAVETLSMAVIISKMKMLYCWFETEMSFEDFLRLFDLTDIEYIQKMTSAIKEAFELIFNASAEKN